jgi:hypothetical protein
MARIFIDDGSIDAADCDDNYVYFDSSNREIQKEILGILSALDHRDQYSRKRLIELCEESIAAKNVVLANSGRAPYENGNSLFAHYFGLVKRFYLSPYTSRH